MERVTQAECAKLLGCTRQYIHKLVKRGRVTLVDGLVDPVAVRLHLKETADPARAHLAAIDDDLPLAVLAPPARPAAAPAASRFHDARDDRESYKARLAQLDYETRIGQVLDRDETTDAFFNIGQRLQKVLEARAHPLANKIAGLTDPREIAAAILQSDFDTLKELHDEFVRTFAEADAAQSAA